MLAVSIGIAAVSSFVVILVAALWCMFWYFDFRDVQEVRALFKGFAKQDLLRLEESHYSWASDDKGTVLTGWRTFYVDDPREVADLAMRYLKGLRLGFSVEKIEGPSGFPYGIGVRTSASLHPEDMLVFAPERSRYEF